MTFHEKEMVLKRGETKQEQAEIQPKLDLIIKKTKEVQKQVGKSLVFCMTLVRK